MKIVVVIVVYDRYDNLKEWIRCFKLSNTQDTELIIIHNFKNEQNKVQFKELCKKEEIKYISRINIGYDIGVLQDIQKERIEFPNDWDYLFYVTDDFILMSKNFISIFLETLQKPNVAIACTELCNDVKYHVRTSGIMMNKETISLIKFPADPMVTRTQCLEFEHKSQNSLLEQIIKMNKLVVQVTESIETSPIWDTHYRGHLNRWNEHYREFKKSN